MSPFITTRVWKDDGSNTPIVSNPNVSIYGDGEMSDNSEIENAAGQLKEIHEFRQGLHQRHIQMIALAGTVGTGIFLSSGRAIVEAGPLGAFLAYTIIGATVASVVYGVGEMGALVPLNGGVIRYAEIFCDPALAFANGWNQIYSYCVSIPSEIVAAAVIIEFWITVNNAIWITVLGLLMLSTAFVFVRVYGELEFGFSILKIMLIIGVNLMALVITCGGAPNKSSIGFAYWKAPYGPFVQYLGVGGSLGRFLGFWKTFDNALFAYSGIENFTLAAAETRNPRHSIPMAARRIFVRILLFYVITIFMIGLIVSSADKRLLGSSGTASQSPFVIAARHAGIKVVPSIINAVVLTSAWSSGNSNILGGSRILYGMATQGHAPAVFTRINRFGIPWVAVALYGVFMSLGYMSLSSSASTVFTWLQNLVSISTLVNLMCICIVYLRFYYGCKKQGIDRFKELPWAAPFQPYITWISLFIYVVLFFTGGFTTFMRGHWSTATFVSTYFNLPFIVIVYFAYKFWAKTKIIPLAEIPIRPFIESWHKNPEPEPKPKRGLSKLNILWS
ncbi:aromatic amino acid and leucine permease [Penicillium chrysogenum]|uniref:Aromatic amino acid and leucine permease n=1 Tax=Penicillium chrysogenum TaxID=5076 RepID=A0ABQ8WZU1_PENCH|nr:aromatic amino acid and leucine permease [Penicillium chrysogenum]KAJ5227912.1 aromatic amino acid and leucine permease [Penicillium chrysogenum]KAJ5284456.1 aromatic amino acid and leucine permease [Penicillium chrysogenum]KAJ5286363.1 aromatic amino acid and leucine permease [Penicillium chrysogenum]KAJ6167415.1 aromatic amino acid and leucine permease arlP-Penicillium chrysogenum [Penicillium chrysogenum]